MKLIAKALALLSIIGLTACGESEKKEGENMSDNLIPRKVLFGNPDKTSVRLSPDGKHISYVAALDGVLNVYVADADDLSTAQPVTADKGRGIRSYFWTYNEDEIIYSKDNDGDENSVLYHLNVKTKALKQITKDGVKAGIANVSVSKPNEIVISMNDRDPRYFDLHKLDLTTGKTELIFKNEGYIGFVLDDENNMRFAQKVMPDGSYEIYRLVNGQMSLFKTVPFDDTTTTSLIGLTRDSSKLYMLQSMDRNTGALYEIDMKTGAEKVIGENDKADISDAIANPKTDVIEAYSYEYLKSTDVVIDDNIKPDFDYLKSLTTDELQIVSRTQDDKRWIVAFTSDTGPVKYYDYDRYNKKAEFMFVHNSKLSDLVLNPMMPVVIKSRDGLDLVSYLSVPKSKLKSQDKIEVSEPMPLVLVVHGGPNARDSWGYDSTHQWLTNRGIAVLSVNYRGSTGLGKEFTRAGDGEWAAKMHDDLLDAVKWAIDKGITTQDKVGIFGGSYGGYATLVGLTMTPDTFAFGVDLVGPSNLKTLYASIPPYWEPFKKSLQRKFGGDPDTPEGAAIVEKKSPLNYVDNINKPLLIAQGKNDPRVKQAEADQIVDAMVAKEIPVVYLLYPDEGHGFARPENRQSFYAVTEQFIGDVLGIETEEVGSDLEGSSMQVLVGADDIGLKAAITE